MTCILINPPRSIGGGSIWRLISSITPPIGLATLAAIAEQEGVPVEIVDANALELDDLAILDALPRQADLIGLSATTPEMPVVARLATMIRAACPQARIVLGGIHPSIFHRELVADGTADLVIRGEGETAFRALLRREPLEQIPNLTWRNPSGKVIANAQSAAFVTLDDLPFPAYGKLPMGSYRSALGAARRHPSIGLISSRGCPGSCTFCCSDFFGKQVRQLSAARTVEQVRILHDRYGIREFSFYDDTFTARPSRVREICSRLIEEGMNVSWSCFARVDTISPLLLRAMKQAGCHQIMYGFESPDDRILTGINKKTDTRTAIRAAQWTKEAGIDVRGAFMLGNPGESRETMRKTIRFSVSLRIPFAIFNITTPYPGTAMFRWASENGLLLHTDWERYDLAHAVLKLPDLPPDLVERMYRRAFLTFYLHPRTIITRLREIVARLRGDRYSCPPSPMLARKR